uniref:Uncharacterized protein n=1 Tax=Arundo donax TaxID=35708 RepID=A0A0A9KMW1_ARUDO
MGKQRDELNQWKKLLHTLSQTHLAYFKFKNRCTLLTFPETFNS